MAMGTTKNAVRRYWDNRPCGTDGIIVNDYKASEAVFAYRYYAESLLYDKINFAQWKGKDVLEVGCGVGSDLIELTRAGARVIGIDLSGQSVSLTKRRLGLYQLNATVLQGDAEHLPFPDNHFDAVFSNGVIHHTINPPKVVDEIYRVLKVGGDVWAMLYHRYSLVALQCYLLYGIGRFRPFRSIDDIMANHMESAGTKIYTKESASQLFSMFTELNVKTMVSLGDVRYTRKRFLPKWVAKMVPSRFGWHIIITGRK